MTKCSFCDSTDVVYCTNMTPGTYYCAVHARQASNPIVINIPSREPTLSFDDDLAQIVSKHLYDHSITTCQMSVQDLASKLRERGHVIDETSFPGTSVDAIRLIYCRQEDEPWCIDLDDTTIRFRFNG